MCSVHKIRFFIQNFNFAAHFATSWDSSARKCLHHLLLPSCASAPRHCTTLITFGEYSMVAATLHAVNPGSLHSMEEYVHSKLQSLRTFMTRSENARVFVRTCVRAVLNPLNAELNPICYLLALLGAHHFLHVSRIRVKSLLLRLLMSYIYGAPILDVSRSHTTTQHSR